MSKTMERLARPVHEGTPSNDSFEKWISWKKKKPWIHMALFDFMKPYVGHRKTSSNMDTLDETMEDVVEVPDDISLELPHFPHPTSPPRPSPSPGLSPSGLSQSASSISSARKRRSSILDPFEQTVVSLLSPKKEEDEDELWLRSLLPQLKRVPNDVKEDLKMRFQMMLYECQFGKCPSFMMVHQPQPFLPQSSSNIYFNN
jgi:hypothetical protein